MVELPSRLVRTGGIALVAMLLSAGISACTTDSGKSSSKNSADKVDEQCADAVTAELPSLKPVREGSGTRTVDSEFGEVEVPVAPKAALGMYTTDVDMLVWLRYPLADSQPIRGDGGYQTFPCFFPRDELADIGTFANFPEYDYEAVLSAEPDFILNGLGYDKKVVKRLSEITTTYSVNAFDGKSWMTHFEQTAKALDREEYYRDWKELYDKRIAEIKAEIDDPASITVAPVGYWDDKFQTACSSGVECQAFEDLGLTISASSLKNDGEGEALSGEQLGRMADIDFAFMTQGHSAEDEKQFDKVLEEAAENPQWKDLDFVKQDGIVGYEMEMTYGSPSGQLAFLEVVAEALTK